MISLITAGHVARNNQGQRIAKNAPTYQKRHHVSSSITLAFSQPRSIVKPSSVKPAEFLHFSMRKMGEMEQYDFA